MQYFFDTEFIEDGRTIDLISIGIVSGDDRTLYLQNADCDFTRASDWVTRNVLMQLQHFDMGTRKRSCKPYETYMSIGNCADISCPWRTKVSIAKVVRGFCDPDKYGKPELWAYYADYDWVAFCQLFGTMMQLPEGYPKYCRDIKQWCDMLGNPKLPVQGKGEHDALSDAKWNKRAYEFLVAFEANHA